jgi:predicted phosphoribosyltransferase
MLFAIGEWYERFEQLEDDEVCRLLEQHRRSRRESGAPDQASR